MGKKLTAAQALEGKFSSEGLVALAGEDANVEIALARSLVNRMDEGDARRLWNRVGNPGQYGDDQGVSLVTDSESPDSTPADLPSWFGATEWEPDAPPDRQQQRRPERAPSLTVSRSRPPPPCEKWLF